MTHPNHPLFLAGNPHNPGKRPGMTKTREIPRVSALLGYLDSNQEQLTGSSGIRVQRRIAENPRVFAVLMGISLRMSTD